MRPTTQIPPVNSVCPKFLLILWTFRWWAFIQHTQTHKTLCPTNHKHGISIAFCISSWFDWVKNLMTFNKWQETESEKWIISLAEFEIENLPKFQMAKEVIYIYVWVLHLNWQWRVLKMDFIIRNTSIRDKHAFCGACTLNEKSSI